MLMARGNCNNSVNSFSNLVKKLFTWGGLWQVVKFVFYGVSLVWLILVAIMILYSSMSILLLLQLLAIFVLNQYLKKRTEIKKWKREVLILIIYIIEVILWLSFIVMSIDIYSRIAMHYNLEVKILLIQIFLILILNWYLKKFTEVKESQRKIIILTTLIIQAGFCLWYFFYSYSIGTLLSI